MPSSNPKPTRLQRKTAEGVAAPASGHICNGLAQFGYQKSIDSASVSGASL